MQLKIDLVYKIIREINSMGFCDASENGGRGEIWVISWS